MTPQNRPEILTSKTIGIRTGLGKLYLTISYLNNKPFEIFATVGKCGKEVQAMTESIGRLVSLWLRSNGDCNHVIKQLKGIGGENPIPYKKDILLSIPDAIAKILEKNLELNQK